MPAFIPSIIRYDSLGSTNTEAASWAMQGAAEGLCIVAEEQTAGRGRLDRRWISPRGDGLYCSFVLRPQLEIRSMPLITLMASLAVHHALRETCDLETDIKWPNDVMANGRKLCGILAEMVDTTIGRAVILGIGINLAHDSFPDELNNIATSIEAATGRRIDRDELLHALLVALTKEYSLLQSEGGNERVVENWTAASSYAEGQKIRVVNGNEILEGTTRGIELDGALRIETNEGELRVIRAGDVTLRQSAAQ